MQVTERLQQIKDALESGQLIDFSPMTGSSPPGAWCMGDLVRLGLARKDYEVEHGEVIGWDWQYLGDTPIRVFDRIIKKGDTVNG